MSVAFTERLVRRACLTLLLLDGGLAACGGKVPAAEEEGAETTTPTAGAEAPDPLDMRTLELDTTPADGAEPGSWVRCLGGALVDGARRFELCHEQSQTWVEPGSDRIAIIATAANATLIEVAKKKARFIDGRARIELDLRTLVAALMPGSATAETTLKVPISVTHPFGTAIGEVELASPRLLALIAGVGPGPAGDHVQDKTR